jgi:hypothetical protein
MVYANGAVPNCNALNAVKVTMQYALIAYNITMQIKQTTHVYSVQTLHNV